MGYACYNDNELLYLVREGSQRALDVLYQKYSVFVYSQVKRYIKKSDKRNDLIQEGLMVVDRCLKNYNKDHPTSLFWYISLSISRRYTKLVKTDNYYRNNIVFHDNDIIYNCSEKEKGKRLFLLKAENFFSDPIDIIIYNEHLIDGDSLLDISKKIGVGYYEIRKRRILMIQELKKILTNYEK